MVMGRHMGMHETNHHAHPEHLNTDEASPQQLGAVWKWKSIPTEQCPSPGDSLATNDLQRLPNHVDRKHLAERMINPPEARGGTMRAPPYINDI